MEMKAFISYSTADKKHGAIVKEALDEIGVKSFLAHDDLAVSEEWQKRIIAELKQCKIFIPLLSEAFKASDWCGQETGFYVKHSKSSVLIIPLSIDKTNPYGFISHIQRHRISASGLDPKTIVDAIGAKWPSVAIDNLLEGVDKYAHSFRVAEARVEPLVRYFAKFSREQAARFARMAVSNAQIWDAQLCRDDYLPKFLKLNKTKIPPSVYKALKYQIENQEWYSARKG